MERQSLSTETATDRCEKLNKEDSCIYISCLKGKIYSGGVKWLLNGPLQRFKYHKSKINSETETIGF